MSASYWVLASDELLRDMDASLLPDGLRLADPAAVQNGSPGTNLPGDAHWYRFTDEDAPPDLEGKRVELILGRQGREGAKTVIIERRVVT